MMKPLRTLVTILIAVIAAPLALAQEITFTAQVDRNQIAAGEHVKLTITLTNAQERFEAPDLGGLVIVQGPFESSSYNFINGRSSSNVSRTWVLTATRPGRYVIGPAKSRVGKGMVETDPITIEVTKGSAAPQEPAVAQGQHRDPNLFIALSLSKSKAYVGEQVVATYQLYNRYSGLEAPQMDPPKLNGFWSEELDTQGARWEERMVNGLGYRVITIKQQLLIPQRAGTLRIDPMGLTCIVGRSFFNPGRTIDVKSNAVELTALPLPANAPAGFNGAVGELELAVKADRTEVSVDDAIEVEVRLSGRANLKLIEAPKLQFPSDFEVYEPRVTDRISLSTGGMSGSRGFQYTVIPRHDGSFDLGSVNMSYFDPKAGAYKTLNSAPLSIVVTPGDGKAGSPMANRVQRSEVATLDSDIRYIRTGDLELREKDRFLFGSWPWAAGMSAPPFAYALLLVWHRKRQRERADATGMRRRAAEKLARKRLREAEAAIKSNDRTAFHGALSKALHGYLGDKLGLGLAEANAVRIADRLQPHADAPAIAADAVRIIAACDMARFAPVDATPQQALYDDALQLIQRIERAAHA
ncbi:MAG: protein BatD [Flavobacteriales bacterium]|nr:protein BatD [Flavobacteriales bacterium]